MQPGLFATHDSRPLLIDAFNEHGGQLVEQLNHAGFKTDFAVSWGAAHAALAHRHGVDAVLPMPFSMQDLTSRLAAFSLRARPTF
jgi:hypothetical protein